MLHRSSPQLCFAHRSNAIAYISNSIAFLNIFMRFHASPQRLPILLCLCHTVPLLRYASLFPCPDTPHSAKQCLCVSAHWSALAYQFLSRLCLRFACLCNAIATLAGHFEALASPNCDLLCHRLLRHTLPWQFDSSQCHRMTHHCNQSLCAVRLHTSTPLHRTLRYTAAYHAVPSRVTSGLSFASAYHSVLCRCLSWPFDTMPSPIITVPHAAVPLHCTPNQAFAVRLCALPLHCSLSRSAANPVRAKP